MSNEDPSETAVSRDAKNETEQPSADATDEANIAATETVPDSEKKRESEEPVLNHLNGQVAPAAILCGCDLYLFYSSLNQYHQIRTRFISRCRTHPSNFKCRTAKNKMRKQYH